MSETCKKQIVLTSGDRTGGSYIEHLRGDQNQF